MLSLPAQIVAFKQLLKALDSNAKCWECFYEIQSKKLNVYL